MAWSHLAHNTFELLAPRSEKSTKSIAEPTPSSSSREAPQEANGCPPERLPALSFVYLNRVHRRAARARSAIELSFVEHETSRFGALRLLERSI